ncbi:MAG: hypothetical protein KA236_15170 [Verrucomicrobia bacterium]|jgi:hypothetical protein|nr:hypothetical protein [Verrucomicrobiota bacterium]
MKQPDPNQAIHCRRLGHPVPLSYCVRESIDRPCGLIFQCWAGRIPVRDYLRNFYTEAQLAAFPKPAAKLASIVDLIKQAQERSSRGNE